MSLWEKVRAWRSRRHRDRQARLALREAFQSRDVLQGTSLKPRHLGRAVIVGSETSGGRVTRVRFGILRHPRPYAFSRQAHKVVVYYEYDVDAGKIRSLKGWNLTRDEGRDAD